jgi:dephospho-CoA kinase
MREDASTIRQFILDNNGSVEELIGQVSNLIAELEAE